MQVYNKLIIFDLDGVLIDSREIHYEALNDALFAYNLPKISREEHLSTYDGLSTSKKLAMLNKRGILKPEMNDKIWEHKQRATINQINWNIEIDNDLIYTLHSLRQDGYKIAVASNSIRSTLFLALYNLGLTPYVDFYQSNEDVSKPKPYPEMYWNCMKACNAIPSTTYILEDSHIGREGAIDSGAHLIPIENMNDVNYEYITDAIESRVKKAKAGIPWIDSKLNVLIPMAGAGSRFAQAGYTFPKPLIEIKNNPMIKVVVDNLNIEANFIFIVQKEHYEKYNLGYLLNLIAPNCKIVQVDGLTEGAACTTLLAKQYINNGNPLVIANSDQFLEWNSNEVMYSFSADDIDAGIVTFKATHPKWSYVRLDDKGFVAEVAEKKVISDQATVGVYYFKHGCDYVDAAELMIKKNIRTNNEFYVAPVFNELFNLAGQRPPRIKAKNIQTLWGLGTPEDLNYFLDNYKGEL